MILTFCTHASRKSTFFFLFVPLSEIKSGTDGHRKKKKKKVIFKENK